MARPVALGTRRIRADTARWRRMTCGKNLAIGRECRYVRRVEVGVSLPPRPRDLAGQNEAGMSGET